MFWEKYTEEQKVPIKSWCKDIEEAAFKQALNLAKHNTTFSHVALMPDCHLGFGMPIGGVIACEEALIPNAVGVDIGCGMIAVETNFPASSLGHGEIKKIIKQVKNNIPVSEGHSHNKRQKWHGFNKYLEKLNKVKKPGWITEKVWSLAEKNLGSLGGGNHFIEIQESESGYVWVMIHSGSRNLGYKIAQHYHNLARKFCEKNNIDLPSSELAYFSSDNDLFEDYFRDMNFALDYAYENRKRILNSLKEVLSDNMKGIKFLQEINIHHNYAALETYKEKQLFIHRKGATSAKKNEVGIIPGSMGTPSYIVKGLGNELSFQSCSHGAGRRMGRREACRTLSVEECNKAMGNVVFEPWSKLKGGGSSKSKRKTRGASYDLSEAPLAYKDIEGVIEAQLDLIKPINKLYPIGVIKG